MARSTSSRFTIAAVFGALTVTALPAGAAPLSANDPPALERACEGKWEEITVKEVGCPDGRVLQCVLKGYKTPFRKRECPGSARVAPPKGVVE